jgi:hypothetical protein
LKSKSLFNNFLLAAPRAIAIGLALNSASMSPIVDGFQPRRFKVDTSNNSRDTFISASTRSASITSDGEAKKHRSMTFAEEGECVAFPVDVIQQLDDDTTPDYYKMQCEESTWAMFEMIVASRRRNSSDGDSSDGESPENARRSSPCTSSAPFMSELLEPASPTSRLTRCCVSAVSLNTCDDEDDDEEVLVFNMD